MSEAIKSQVLSLCIVSVVMVRFGKYHFCVRNLGLDLRRVFAGSIESS